MCRDYGLKSLSTSELTDFYLRVETDPLLLEAYYWNMKAQSHRVSPCTTALCRANTLCALKWWSTKGEYLACVDGARTASSVVQTSNKAKAAAYQLAPSNVYIAIIMTVFATVVVIALVLAVSRGLKKSGAIKTPEEREKEREGLFPML